MTTYGLVAEAILSLGRATMDDIAPLFPELTRKQLRGAIQNARHYGLVTILKPGVYGSPEQQEHVPRRHVLDSWLCGAQI